MADTDRLRSYLDSNYASLGIDWRERNRIGPDAWASYLRQKIAAKFGPEDKWDANQRSLYTNLLMGSDYLRRAEGGMPLPASARGFIDNLGNDSDPLSATRPSTEQAAGPTGPDPRKQYLDWITQFTQAMGRPAGPGDPIFDSLTKMGAARASMNVGAQGLRVGRGGLGELAIQQGANAAVMPYEMQRKQLQAQGLGMLDQAQRGWEGLEQNAHLLNQNTIKMNNDAMAQAWAQSQNQNQATGATIGGGLGLLGGAVATAFNPALAPLIPGLMAGGSQIGAGIAGNSGPSYKPQQYRPYTPNSSGY